MKRLAALLLATAGLAACTVGPNYQKPQTPTPSAFSETVTAPRVQTTTAEPDVSAWWTVFGDPVLKDLMRRGLADNPDLQAAASRIREARDQVHVAAAAEWPSINASANAIAFNSNRKSPGSSAASGGGSSGGSGAAAGGGFALPSHLNLYSAGFDATWEVDLFGGARRAIESAKASEEAQVWSRRDAQVSLTAEIANDYLTLRALQARIAIDQNELAHQRDLFALIRARRQSGFTTELDVNQQTAQVAAATAEIPQLEAQAKAQLHALSVLLGTPPETPIEGLQPAQSTTLPPPPPTLPVGLPSELLERRPDIRAAERRVAAANAQIGVQTANLFPKLNLIGLASFAGQSLGGLFDSQNLSSVGVGMLTQPIFNAGKTRASIAAAREEKTQADLAYRTAVLGAFKDVEDALGRLQGEEQRRQALVQSVTAAQNSLGIARSQYQAGLVNFISVLQAENAVLTSQDQLTQSDAQSLTDLVALYKALGGGWSG